MSKDQNKTAVLESLLKSLYQAEVEPQDLAACVWEKQAAGLKFSKDFNVVFWDE